MTDKEALEILNDVCTRNELCDLYESTQEAVKRAVLALEEKVAKESNGEA